MIDSGSTGDFMNSVFAKQHGLNLSPRAVPMACIAFDGSPVADGEVTHCWDGHMTMIGSHNALFDSSICLDVTKIGGYDLILGLPWLKKHDTWVGGADPFLILEHPVLSFADSQGNLSSCSPPLPVPSHISNLPD